MSNKIKKMKIAEVINYLFQGEIISAKQKLFLVSKLKEEDFDSVERYLLSLRVDNYSRMKILDSIGGKQNEDA